MRARAFSSRSRSRTRLGRPVRRSWRAWRASWTSNRLRSLMSRTKPSTTRRWPSWDPQTVTSTGNSAPERCTAASSRRGDRRVVAVGQGPAEAVVVGGPVADGDRPISLRRRPTDLGPQPSRTWPRPGRSTRAMVPTAVEADEGVVGRLDQAAAVGSAAAARRRSTTRPSCPAAATAARRAGSRARRAAPRVHAQEVEHGHHLAAAEHRDGRRRRSAPPGPRPRPRRSPPGRPAARPAPARGGHRRVRRRRPWPGPPGAGPGTARGRPGARWRWGRGRLERPGGALARYRWPTGQPASRHRSANTGSAASSRVAAVAATAAARRTTSTGWRIGRLEPARARLGGRDRRARSTHPSPQDARCALGTCGQVAQSRGVRSRSGGGMSGSFHWMKPLSKTSW